MEYCTKDKYIQRYTKEIQDINEALAELDELHEFTPEQQDRYNRLMQELEDVSQARSELKTHP